MESKAELDTKLRREVDKCRRLECFVHRVLYQDRLSILWRIIANHAQQHQQNILTMSTAITQNNTQIAAKHQQQDIKNFSAQQKVVQQKATGMNANAQNISKPTKAQQNPQQYVQVSQSAIPTAQIINQIQQPGGQLMQFEAPVRSWIWCMFEIN